MAGKIESSYNFLTCDSNSSIHKYTYQDSAMLTGLHRVFGCFCVVTAELRSCGRDHAAYKTYFLSDSQQKSLPTAGVEDDGAAGCGGAHR